MGRVTPTSTEVGDLGQCVTLGPAALPVPRVSDLRENALDHDTVLLCYVSWDLLKSLHFMLLLKWNS